MPHSILNMCRRRGSIRNINISSSSYQLQHLTFTRQFEFWMMMSRATTRKAARSLESTFKCFLCMINGRIYIAWCGCRFNGLWEREEKEKRKERGGYIFGNSTYVVRPRAKKEADDTDNKDGHARDTYDLSDVIGLTSAVNLHPSVNYFVMEDSHASLALKDDMSELSWSRWKIYRCADSAAAVIATSRSKIQIMTRQRHSEKEKTENDNFFLLFSFKTPHSCGNSTRLEKFELDMHPTDTCTFVTSNFKLYRDNRQEKTARRIKNRKIGASIGLDWWLSRKLFLFLCLHALALVSWCLLYVSLVQSTVNVGRHSQQETSVIVSDIEQRDWCIAYNVFRAISLIFCRRAKSFRALTCNKINKKFNTLISSCLVKKKREFNRSNAVGVWKKGFCRFSCSLSSVSAGEKSE